MATYWVRTSKSVRGPFSLEKLADLATTGRLKEFHKVSCDQRDWRPASSLKGLSFPTFDEIESKRWQHFQTNRARTTYIQNALNAGEFLASIAFGAVFAFAFGAAKAGQGVEVAYGLAFLAVLVGVGAFCLGMVLGFVLKIVGIDVPGIDGVAGRDREPLNPMADAIATWASRFLTVGFCIVAGASLYGAWLFVKAIADQWGWNIGMLLATVIVGFLALLVSFYRTYLRG